MTAHDRRPRAAVLPFPSPLLTAADVAAMLHVSVKQVHRLPLPVVDVSAPGSRRPAKRWRRADVDAYITARVLGRPPNPD